MKIKNLPLMVALLLFANGTVVDDAFACDIPIPTRPIVKIAPKSLLSMYRAAYGHAGFRYLNEKRFGNHVELHFRFALREFAGKEEGKLSIAFDLGSGAVCNPCRVNLVHMNVGDDYTLEQYDIAQKLIIQKHGLAESELARRLGDKIGPTPATGTCPGS